jgi:hypothetical protein
LGKILRASQWKRLVYFLDIWSSLRPFDIFCGNLAYFVVILVYFSLCWYIAPWKIWQPCDEPMTMDWALFKTELRHSLKWHLPDSIVSKKWKYMENVVARWYLYFHTKNSDLGIFGRTLERTVWAFFTAIWYNLWPLRILFDNQYGIHIVWSFRIFLPVLVCCT